MQSLADNNLIRFISIKKKKDGLFANFRAKGVRGGLDFSTAINVDLGALEIDLAETPLESVIEAAARVAEREVQKADLQFEGMQSI